MLLRPSARHTLAVGFVWPCLPTSAPHVPSGRDWLHEVKHDGFRVIARKIGKRVKLYSRSGNDLTYRFPLIVEAMAKLRVQSCIIDGEAVACDDGGLSSFDRLCYRRTPCPQGLGCRHAATRASRLSLFRSWKLLDQKDFQRVREAHWKKLPYWVLFPWGLEIAGSTALIWYHPAGSPTWAIYGGTGCLWLSLILTIFMWGQWQKKLSGDPLSSESPYLAKILKTHWIRTSLMSAYAIIVLVWVIQILA